MSRRPDPASAAALPVGGLLNWSDSRHFSTDARPCRHCGSPTHLRDHKGRPADKVCAEEALSHVVHALAGISQPSL